MEQHPLRVSDILQLVDMLMPPIGGGPMRKLTAISHQLRLLYHRHGCQAFIKLLAPPEQYDRLLAQLRARQPNDTFEIRPGLICLNVMDIGVEIEAYVGEILSSTDPNPDARSVTHSTRALLTPSE